ncbi:hypothetical protein ATY41_08205 [Leifsonia xyli subsp. xyli]|uniref:Uncharacterized protein n=1 Tax=Leifsonia xyli subsp. xyli TaxID=59736 RepID=A0A1E2SM11_LEIXY|nr:hypothetical protein [Leifsonia xyli]ODA90885.1 hypothetical protein ATY41_08205 [Leifsonia xyli subsp. xyli]
MSTGLVIHDTHLVGSVTRPVAESVPSAVCNRLRERMELSPDGEARSCLRHGGMEEQRIARTAVAGAR